MTDAPLTYQEVTGLAIAALGDQAPGTPESAERMQTFLDEIEGREIVTDHDHPHTILGAGVRTEPGKFHLDLRVSPCPEVMVTIVGPPPCPECTAKKHDNCDGRTWDNAADDIAPCPCAKAGHGP